jgi:hypothetical protein
MTDHPLTLEGLLAACRRLKEEIGPPPPVVRISRHATALPPGKPHTLDMQEMVDRLGQVRVPAAYRIDGNALGGGPDVIYVHPLLMKRLR